MRAPHRCPAGAPGARPRPAALPAVALIATVALAAAAGCSRPYRFLDAEPVLALDDARPIPVPHATRFHHAMNLYREVIERPAVDALDAGRIPEAEDVNSLDDVPASSWYTPRLGHRPVPPEELLRGPTDVGPPELPLTVVKAKSGGGNPGFIVADARGERYLVKFDPPEFPAIETTTALVVNRLFWGFGYNVPEDFLFFFAPEDLRVDPAGGLSRADVEAVLAEVAAPVDGRYRATVSLLVPGIVVGPVAARGVRPDDPNDRIPHEDRRVLRALRVFGAFVNHSDMRPDNSLAVYAGEPGQGHVVHYLLDFGEAFGGHGAERERLWDGFAPIFGFRKAGRRLATLGLEVEGWERIRMTPWKSVGAFEADAFRPADWHETTPYAPIRRSRPADDYWAVKVLGALTREHLEALVRAARYPDEDAAAYVVDTLMKRREKVLRFALGRVTPVDPLGIDADGIRLRDRERELFPGDGGDVVYEVRAFDGSGRQLEEREIPAGDGADFVLSTPLLGETDAYGYLRFEITSRRDGVRAPAPAELHFRPDPDGRPRLVGVVH